jgi:hypothetical protein
MNDPRTGMEGLLSQRLGVAAEKQRVLDEATRKKEAKFNPLSLDNLEHVDGDTWRLKEQDQLVRMGNGVDTFESQEWAYESNPQREEAHKRAMSKLTGTPQFMISRDDLLEYGRAQADETKKRISELGASGNLGYKQTGVDAHGRAVGELQDLSTGENPFADYSGREQNANYQSKYNAEQRVRDLFSGERGEHERFNRARNPLQVLKDAPTNLIAGAGEMANDLMQAASIIAKPGTAGAGSTAMFERNRDRLQSFRDKFTSPQAKAQERLRQKNASRARRIYDSNYKRNLEQGMSEGQAKFKAGAAEFGDTVKQLIANPGHVFDAAVESLPYMIGVGAVGRMVATKGAEALSKKVLQEVALAGGTTEQAAASAARFATSKVGRAAVDKLATRAGVATVGLTEGLSNSAEVYASVARMTEEEAMQSDTYLKLREEGMEHGEAVREMAEDAFHKTFLKNVAVAAAASAVTGAAGWEAGLFHAKGAVKVAKELPKAESIKGGVGRTIQKAARFSGPAATKEAAEELIQSGGGEFLGQLAKFEATGEEVGPGIGAAAAEGAVVGFASGGGMQSTAGLLKKLGSMEMGDKLKAAASNYKKGKQSPEVQSAIVDNAVHGTPMPVAKGETPPPPAPPPITDGPMPKAGVDLEKLYKKTTKSKQTNPISLFVELDEVRKIAEARGKPLSEETLQVHNDVYGELAKEALASKLTDIAEIEDGKVSDRDVAILGIAAELGMTVDTKNLTQEQREYVESEIKLAEDFEAVNKIREEEVALAEDEKQKKSIRSVFLNKFGDFKEGTNGKPGLGYYNRRMRELMNLTKYGEDNPELLDLAEGLRNFAESQNTYLENAREAVKQQKTVGNFTYTGEQSARMLDVLVKEQAKFDEIVNGLRGRYNTWVQAGKAPEVTQIENATGAPAETSPETAEARKADAAEKAKARKANPDNKRLRKTYNNIMNKTKAASKNRQNALKKLLAKAKKTKDLFLIRDISKALTSNANAQKAARIQANKKKAAAETQASQVESQTNEDGTPKFAIEDESIPLPEGLNIVDENSEFEAEPEAKTPTKRIFDPEHDTATTIREAAQQGSQGALEFIAKNSQNKAFAAMARRLQKVMGDRDVQIIPLTGPEFADKLGSQTASAAFRYFKGKREGIIYLNTDKLTNGNKYMQGIMHEAIHAALDNYVEEGLKGELKERLYKLRMEVVRGLAMSDHPGATKMMKILAADPEELLTHGFTTPWFVEFMQELQLGEKTAFEKFVQLIADIMGFKDTSALGELLSITEGIFEEVAPGTAESTIESTVGEANIEEAGSAPRAGTATESVAEDTTAEAAALEKAEAERRDKAVRLAEVRRLRTLVTADKLQGHMYVTNPADQAFLDRLLSENVPPLQALEQLLANIEPNPAEQNVTATSEVPAETIAQVAEHGAILNDRDNKQGIDARPIPSFLRHLANLVKSAMGAFQRDLAKRRLAASLSGMFEVDKSKVRDLLASDDYIMDVLTDPVAREEFFEKVGTTPEEELALRTYAEFYTAFDKTLRAGMEPLSHSNTLNQVEKNLLYYLQNDNGVFDPNVVGAMALEAMQWVTSDGHQAMFNNPETIRSITGAPDGSPITGQMWEALGRGTLRTGVVQSLGYKTMAHLNLRAKKGRRPLMNEMMVAALGAQILTTLIDMGNLTPKSVPRIRQHSISPAAWKQMTGKTVKQDVVLVSNNFREVADTDPNTTRLWQKVDVNAVFRDRIIEGKEIFTRLFSSTSNIRTPLFREPTIGDVPTTIKRSISKIPEPMRERINHDNQNYYTADTSIVDLLKRFGDPRDFLRIATDWATDEEIDRAHRNDREGLRGRNRQLMTDLTEGVGWTDRYGDEKFYLPSIMTRNGRLLIDSNIINPQASKLHRFMFVRKGWNKGIVKKSPSEMNDTERLMYTGLMTAVGLGMGIKTDQVPLAEIVQTVEDRMNEDGKWKDALNVLNGKEEFNALDLEILSEVLNEEGMHTFAALKVLNDWRNAKDGDTVDVAMPHETDGVNNGYIIGLLLTPPAVVGPAYKRLLNAGGIFFEGDPWKNVAEYRAAGNLDNYQEIAKGTREQLGRIKSEAESTVIHPDTPRATKVSVLIRRELSTIARSGLVPDQHELNAGHKVGRDWSKDPLMQGAYGASTRTLANAMIQTAIDKFHTLLAKSNADLDLAIEEATARADVEAVEKLEASRAQITADAMNRAYETINMVIIAKRKSNWKRYGGKRDDGSNIWETYELLGTRSPDGKLTAADIQALANAKYKGDLRELSQNFILSKEATQHFSQGLRSTYGVALGAALNGRLGPVLDQRARLNAANKMNNLAYVAEFDRQVAEREAAGERLTPKDRQGIKKGLMRQGLVPTVATPASEGVDDSIEVTNDGVEYMRAGTNLLEGVALLNHPVQLTQERFGHNRQTQTPKAARTITGRITSRTPNTEVGVAAVVKTIQSVEAVINSLTWGMGPYSVMNIHDAQLSPWWAAEDVAQTANTGFGTTIAGYNMLQQFVDTTSRIQNSLMSENDSRLSKETKDRIALEMLNQELEYPSLRTPFPQPLGGPKMTDVEKGYWIMDQVQLEMQGDTLAAESGKETLLTDTRWINQYAQEGTEVPAPNGIDVNAPSAWEGSTAPAEPSLKEMMLEEDPIDFKFSEEFENQLESDKIVSVWDGLAQHETGDISVPHQKHLRSLIETLIAPGLKTIEPIFQRVLEAAGDMANVGEWEGDVLRLKTAGARLTSNADVSLQETAAQEYVSAVVRTAVEGNTKTGIDPDHFIRKELRRLFEMAKDNLTWVDLMPETVVGDRAIAEDLAQKRYDWIFNNTDANEAYIRFMSVGLTNVPFATALAGIENVDQGFKMPSWDQGYLRGLMSIFRQILTRISGTGMRYNGGTLADATRALAQQTIAVNQRNQQRLQDLRNGVDGTSRVQKVNQRLVNGINNRFVEPLAAGLRATNKKRLDPKNPTLPGFVRSATYVAFKTRNSETREEYNRFYRALTSPHDIGKDNPFFQTIAEVTPWSSTDFGWYDLLRKSKYVVDMARQEVNDNTRAYLNDSFDKKQHKSKAHKMAITRTILKTDLSSLIDGVGSLKFEQLAELIASRSAVTTERRRLEAMLQAEMAKEGLPPSLYNLMQNQARSLGSMMTSGSPTVGNPMLNASNIVKQWMLPEKQRTQIKATKDITSLVDRLATIYALESQSLNDMRLTNEIISHEMNRTDVGDDNGFSRLIGSHIDFKELAKENLFRTDPHNMIKGYVYEIFDGDVNVEYVLEGSPRQAQMEAEGMMLVGPVQKDSHDTYQGRRLLYKGLKGLATYNKSVVSLTDLQHRGANLFSTNGYQSQQAFQSLAEVRANNYLTAGNQLKKDYVKPGNSMVPIMNAQGEIIDYRYMMTEHTKQSVLKKEDPFDRVLPRMFASITDRANTIDINRDVVHLLLQEYKSLRKDPGTRFVKIAESSDQAGKEMWRLLPEDMKRNAEAAFGFKGLYVRDDVANLVLGFRKATVSNLKKKEGGSLWGKQTPAVRIAEKIWQEIVSLMRIKIAILTPAVVVGNIASNIAMLLSEGIPLSYIRRSVSEAISGMRQYQKDRAQATELMRRIGSAQALGKDTRAMEVKLSQLNADLAANPVGQLVEEGLFTSITADLGVDDDTMRGSLIQKAEDALGDKGGKVGKAAAHIVKEAYMLPGSKGYQAAVAATQYGDFVARYTKYMYDTKVGKPVSKFSDAQQVLINKLTHSIELNERTYDALPEQERETSFIAEELVRQRNELERVKKGGKITHVRSEKGEAINEALAAFIYYDIPQPKYLQALNDNGLVMFTKFFLRIQSIVARMYSQNPVSAFSVLALQKGMLPQPFSENIMNYGAGDGLTNKFNNPLNLPGKVANTLNPAEPALLQWVFNPFGL